MKLRFLYGVLATCVFSMSAQAALTPGDQAPDFSVEASLNGQLLDFSLANALSKGPSVVYFFPSAFTQGCDLEAHTFAENRAKFEAAGASIVGVSADSLERLHEFSKDPDFCAGEFPVASDPEGDIAKKYDLEVVDAPPEATDTKGQVIDHKIIERATYVIDSDGKITALFSTNRDGLSASDHVDRALAEVQKLAQ